MIEPIGRQGLGAAKRLWPAAIAAFSSFFAGKAIADNRAPFQRDAWAPFALFGIDELDACGLERAPDRLDGGDLYGHDGAIEPLEPFHGFDRDPRMRGHRRLLPAQKGAGGSEQRALVERIGLGAHQRLSATHLDTGHLHLHVAINKIHPESFRCIEPYYDKRRLMQACVELEAKHGLIRTAHGKAANIRDATRTAREATLALLRSDILPKVLTKPGPQTWDELHRVLRGQGLELRLRGAGLVFQNTAGTVRVKASMVARELSLKALTDKLGPYKAFAGADEAVSQSPAGGNGGASLYQRYAAERAAATKTEQAKKTLEAFELVKASYVRQARAIAEDRALTNVGKRAAYREFRKRRQAAFDALRQQLRTQITAKTSGALFPSWPAYVRSQAALGDAEAIALLQRWRMRLQKQNPSPPRNTPSDPGRHGAKPQGLSRVNDASYHPAWPVQALPASKMQRHPASRRISRR